MVFIESNDIIVDLSFNKKSEILVEENVAHLVAHKLDPVKNADRHR